MTSAVLRRLFETGLDLNPDGVAVDHMTSVTTYRELDVRSRRLAEAIGAMGIEDGTAVIVSGKTPAFYEAYLACAWLGLTIVPVDPVVPRRRRDAVIAACRPNVVLSAADGPPGDPVDLETTCTREAAGWRISCGRDRPVPTDGRPPAYLLFTSGSTGIPKGVPISGDAVEAYVESVVELWRTGPGDRFSHTFGLGFDPSVHDMFVAWRSGGVLSVPRAREDVLITRYVHDRGITHWFSVPSAIDLAVRARQLDPGALPTVRVMAFCGEPLSYAQAEVARASAPSSRVFNFYGPTEMTIVCVQYELPTEAATHPRTPNDTVPIGTPLPGVESFVVREDADEPDAPGELVLRGVQRFDGYLDRRANETAFVALGDDPGPADARQVPQVSDWYRTGDLVSTVRGQLVHRGRVDDQVKVLGHRIEPGEVEAVMSGIGDVSRAVVVAVETAPGLRRLIGYYAARTTTPALLQVDLREQLPPYMVPSELIRIESFPLTANGKIDRGALRARWATTQ